VSACFGFVAAFAVAFAADERGEVARVVDAALEQPVKERKFSGAVLVAKDGKPLVQSAYGFADWTTKRPNTPETAFMIFSVTKQFTAAAILRLQDHGLLSVSDPVSKYLASWPDEWQTVTLHHLLSHTAGIDVDTLYFWLIQHHPRFWEDPTQTPPKYEPKALVSEPGKKFRYSNAGYMVLSLVVERVSGRPFADALQENVFRPLQMTRTQCERATSVPNRARGHTLTPTKAEITEQKTHFIVGAGDVVSTLDDMLKWDKSLYGDAFLSANAKQAMFTTHVRGSKWGFGYDWQVRSGADGRPFYLFGGSGAGFRSLVIRQPEKRLYLLLMANCESPLDAEFAVKLLHDVETALAKPDVKR